MCNIHRIERERERGRGEGGREGMRGEWKVEEKETIYSNWQISSYLMLTLFFNLVCVCYLPLSVM